MPAVELGVAISILYTAAVAIAIARPRLTTAVTVLPRLLQVLGFSFVPGEIPEVEAPNLWQSLFAVDVGSVCRQLLIVLALWPVIQLIAWPAAKPIGLMRWAVPLPCIMIAAIWIGERSVRLVFPV